MCVFSFFALHLLYMYFFRELAACIFFSRQLFSIKQHETFSSKREARSCRSKKKLHKFTMIQLRTYSSVCVHLQGKHYYFRQKIFDRPFFHFQWKIFDTNIFDRKSSTHFEAYQRKFSTDFLYVSCGKFSTEFFQMHKIC